MQGSVKKHIVTQSLRGKHNEGRQHAQQGGGSTCCHQAHPSAAKPHANTFMLSLELTYASVLLLVHPSMATQERHCLGRFPAGLTHDMLHHSCHSVSQYSLKT